MSKFKLASPNPSPSYYNPNRFKPNVARNIQAFGDLWPALQDPREEWRESLCRYFIFPAHEDQRSERTDWVTVLWGASFFLHSSLWIQMTHFTYFTYQCVFVSHCYFFQLALKQKKDHTTQYLMGLFHCIIKWSLGSPIVNVRQTMHWHWQTDHVSSLPEVWVWVLVAVTIISGHHLEHNQLPTESW